MTRRSAVLPSLLVLAVAVGAWLALRSLRSDEGASAGETLSDRRERVESLNLAAKEDLLEHWKRFSQMDREEQDQVRRLHAQLEDDEHSAALRRVMLNYYDWVKTLPRWQQEEIREMPPERRVQQVKKVLEQQAQKAGKGPPLAEAMRSYRNWKGPLQPKGKRSAWLSPQDVEGLLEWFDGYVRRHGTQVLEKLPETQRQRISRELEQTKDVLRRQETLTAVWLRWLLDNPGKVPVPAEAELAELRAKLSPETRRRLESQPPEQQWRTLSSLVPLFALQQYAARRVDGALPAVSEEELAHFFEKELNARQRDQLLSLPGEEMTRELWRMYIRWKLPQLPYADRGSKDKHRTGGPRARNPGGTAKPSSPAPPANAEEADKR
jgi:hypothetical protein